MTMRCGSPNSNSTTHEEAAGVGCEVVVAVFEGTDCVSVCCEGEE